MPQMPHQGKEKEMALQTLQDLTHEGSQMRAIILAAGMGSRLRPLTDKTPKALVPFKGVPMVERVIRKLADAGISRIMVNVHHFADLSLVYFLQDIGCFREIDVDVT